MPCHGLCSLRDAHGEPITQLSPTTVHSSNRTSFRCSSIHLLLLVRFFTYLLKPIPKLSLSHDLFQLAVVVVVNSVVRPLDIYTYILQYGNGMYEVVYGELFSIY